MKPFQLLHLRSPFSAPLFSEFLVFVDAHLKHALNSIEISIQPLSLYWCHIFR
jgi:hypothetical protein